MNREEIMRREQASRPQMFATIGLMATEIVIGTTLVAREAAQGDTTSAVELTILGGMALVGTGIASIRLYNRRNQ